MKRRLLPFLAYVISLTLGALVAVNARTPRTYFMRDFEVWLVLGCILVALGATRKATPLRFAPVVLVLALAGWREGTWLHDRATVRDATAEELAELGRHVITGVPRSREDLAWLLARKAIGGVFVSNRVDDLAATIKQWKSVHPDLIVTTDQEGGVVSRLSPPLPQQPSLGSFVDDKKHVFDRAETERLAKEQAAGLAGLGIDVNFAPVVDLAFNTTFDGSDLYSRLPQRTIARDPMLVSEVATLYARALAEKGVTVTAKHFPGLGRVRDDTHFFAARNDAATEDLDKEDWAPYRAYVASGMNVWVMVAHVLVPRIDPDALASQSRAVVSGKLRDSVGHKGIVVTDDLCMFPAFYGDGGIEAAAVRAINAGVDELLIAYDPDQYYRAMAALIRARRSGALDRREIAASAARITAFAARSRSTAANSL